MNLPLDKLQKIKRPHKLGILFGTVVLLGVLFYFLLYSPMQGRIDTLNNDLVGLQKKINEHRAKVKEIPIIKKRLASITLEFKALSRFLPLKKEVDQLLRQISEYGAQSELNVVLFAPNLKDKVMDFYAEISFQMKVEGPYLNVAQFFYRTALMDRIVNIENIKMEKPELVDGNLILTTSCTGKTFRFLTEAEQKAREEARKTAQKKGN